MAHQWRRQPDSHQQSRSRMERVLNVKLQQRKILTTRIGKTIFRVLTITPHCNKRLLYFRLRALGTPTIVGWSQWRESDPLLVLRMNVILHRHLSMVTLEGIEPVIWRVKISDPDHQKIGPYISNYLDKLYISLQISERGMETPLERVVGLEPTVFIFLLGRQAQSPLCDTRLSNNKN